MIRLLFSFKKTPLTIKSYELIVFSKIFENGLSKEEIQALLQFKDDQYQQFADKLSGSKRLFAFVLCLIGKPDIIFLDELTAGDGHYNTPTLLGNHHDLESQVWLFFYSSHYIEVVFIRWLHFGSFIRGNFIRDTTHAM